jgi:hypothetical protein
METTNDGKPETDVANFVLSKKPDGGYGWKAYAHTADLPDFIFVMHGETISVFPFAEKANSTIVAKRLAKLIPWLETGLPTYLATKAAMQTRTEK